MERALARKRERDSEPHRNYRRIRLMLVDDSTVARAVLARMIETDPAFEISAVAGTAEDAVEALGQIQVDIVLLDLEMPGQGGMKLLPKIIAAARGAKVMIVSTLAEEGAEQTLKALALGAADTLPKPGTGRFAGRFSEVLLTKLKALGRATFEAAQAHAVPGRAAKAADLSVLRAMPSDPIEVLAIGASTGGIHALGSLFAGLPARIGVPILVTQHLPAAFMQVFARQLATTSKREVLVAEDDMRLLPDRIILAPGEASIALERLGQSVVVRLRPGRSASGCLPSVDPMLESVGRIYGPSAVGVILTGMGRDGTDGALQLVRAGGSVIAQDEATSAVWGMPRAALEAGVVSALLPPDKIARRIVARIEEPVPCK